MKTSLKTGFAPDFLLLPPKLGGGAAAPLAPPARTPPLTKLKRISSSSSDYVVLTFLGQKKYISLPWTSRRQATLVTTGE